jgi:hypothetical protein
VGAARQPGRDPTPDELEGEEGHDREEGGRGDGQHDPPQVRGLRGAKTAGDERRGWAAHAG